MTVEKITNHEEQALAKRLEQWIDKPNLESAIKSLVGGYQEIETMFCDLNEKRIDINNSEGEQLDQIGTIVGQTRQGLTDEFYRILLLAKIAINVSNGEPERIISIAKLLTNAEFIHYINHRQHDISIGSDGVINPLTADFILRALQRATVASVRVTRLCIYDGDDSFAFDGPNVNSPGLGFGTTADSNVGGQFGQCYEITDLFSFDGSNTGDGGFGTIADPLVGGVFE